MLREPVVARDLEREPAEDDDDDRTENESTVAERRRGRAINGWLVIDKPAGITSAAVVSRVRRATGAAKAGHGGTLDPLATGVLPIAFGEATKTVSYVMDGREDLSVHREVGRAAQYRRRRGRGDRGERHAARRAADIRGVLDRLPRRDRAGSADLLGDQDGGRASLRAGPRRPSGRAVGAASARRSNRAARLPGRGLRHLRGVRPARASTCGRWLATSVALSAPSGTSSRCAGSRSGRSREDTGDIPG